MSDRFDYETAREDLWEQGLDPDELPDKSPECRDAYLRKNGVNPNRYKPNPSRRDYGSHSRSGGGSGIGGCFLTSACVQARSLPDDCEELKTLRDFRDSYMMSTEQGRQEVEQYYSVAPEIVAAINQSPEAKKIWGELFSMVIAPAVAYIQQGDLSKAHQLYKDCVLRLQERYVPALAVTE